MDPTKVKIVSNDFIHVLPECPHNHWPSQMWNDPKLCFCPCSSITEPWREKKKVSIHPNHGYKTKNMTSMQLLNHLETEGDSTHKAILVYLNKLATFQQGPARHIPSKGVSGSVAANIRFPLESALSWFFLEPPKGPTDFLKNSCKNQGKAYSRRDLILAVTDLCFFA